MNINDILGVGKILPVDKLIELFSKSVGRLSKPYFDRKNIDTKSYEIKKLAEARAEEMKIISRALIENTNSTNQIEYKDDKIAITAKSTENPAISNDKVLATLHESAQRRAEFQNLKAQLNLESIATFAAEDLKDEGPVSEEPVDEDWSTRFFKYAEDISNEEMQTLWGKILAGEIKRPKSFSLRTLELLRNLSKEEADLFTKAANLAVSRNNEAFLYKGKEGDTLEKYALNFNSIAHLIEIGLVHPGDLVTYNFKQVDRISNTYFTCGNIILFVNREANSPVSSIDINTFTKSGIELLSLITQQPPIDYLKELAGNLSNSGTTVKYAYILNRNENNIQHSPLQEF